MWHLREGADDFGPDVFDLRTMERDGFADLEPDGVNGIQRLPGSWKM
jgi:hypothetical protein